MQTLFVIQSVRWQTVAAVEFHQLEHFRYRYSVVRSALVEFVVQLVAFYSRPTVGLKPDLVEFVAVAASACSHSHLQSSLQLFPLNLDYRKSNPAIVHQLDRRIRDHPHPLHFRNWTHSDHRTDLLPMQTDTEV